MPPDAVRLFAPTRLYRNTPGPAWAGPVKEGRCKALKRAERHWQRVSNVASLRSNLQAGRPSSRERVGLAKAAKAIELLIWACDKYQGSYDVDWGIVGAALWQGSQRVQGCTIAGVALSAGSRPSPDGEVEKGKFTASSEVSGVSRPREPHAGMSRNAALTLSRPEEIYERL
jgi:hypothetical protein